MSKFVLTGILIATLFTLLNEPISITQEDIARFEQNHPLLLPSNDHNNAAVADTVLPKALDTDNQMAYTSAIIKPDIELE